MSSDELVKKLSLGSAGVIALAVGLIWITYPDKPVLPVPRAAAARPQPKINIEVVPAPAETTAQASRPAAPVEEDRPEVKSIFSN